MTAQQALEQQATVNAAIAELATALLSPLSLQDISHLVLRQAQQLTNSSWGFVGYADLRSGQSHCPIAVSDLQENWPGVCPDRICDWALKNRQPITTALHQDIPPCLATLPRSAHHIIALPASVEYIAVVITLARADHAYTRQEVAATERLAALYALAVQQEQTKVQLRLQSAALQAAANAIVITARNGNIIWVNPAFTRLTGYMAEEVRGKTLSVLKSGQQDPAYYRVLWTTILNGEVWQGKLINRRKDGSLYIEEQTITPVRDEQGEISHFIAIKQDVTERERAQEALYIKDSAIASSLNGIAFADLSGNLTYVNEAFLELWGYDKVLGRSVTEFCQMQDKAREIIENLRRQGKWTGELTASRKDGSAITVQLSASLITDADGRPISMMASFVDITDRVRVENELSRMLIELKRSNVALERYARELEEANHLKDLFTDIIRHDLLNPAGVINAMAKLLETASDREVKQIAGSIQSSATRLIEMIEAASAYARLESAEQLEKTDQDLGRLFQKAADSLAAALTEKSMRLIYVPQGEFPARVNPIIENVFANLLSNAIKYSPRGQSIEVSILDRGDCYHAYVKDWGYGIPAEDKPRLFTRFQRVDRMGVKGTGLGLAIVKRVMELHGGRIWIEDNPEGGSIFFVEIPKG